MSLHEQLCHYTETLISVSYECFSSTLVSVSSKGFCVLTLFSRTFNILTASLRQKDKHLMHEVLKMYIGWKNFPFIHKIGKKKWNHVLALEIQTLCYVMCLLNPVNNCLN
jgi:hypothetical protein